MKWWQTTRSWVETATVKTEIANTMVKFHQQHGLLFIFTKWPLLKFGLGTYVRVFNKSQWPAKFAGYFTQTRRLLFFGNYPSLNRVFMCCQWIKKPKLHDVCVLFKHSFLLQNSGNASKRSRCQSFSRKSHLYRKSFLPHRLQSFCHLLEIFLKTLFNVLTSLPHPPPPQEGFIIL